MPTEYTVILERGPKNWSAYVPDVPDVPGCIAAAKTRDETEKLIREAIVLQLELMQEDGDPIPCRSPRPFMSPSEPPRHYGDQLFRSRDGWPPPRMTL
jgi:predicted RNase H-like HicB family nuclease